MSISDITIIVLIGITFFVGLLHLIFKRFNNKLADKIESLWKDWFEELFYILLVLLAVALIIAAIGFFIYAIKNHPE